MDSLRYTIVGFVASLVLALGSIACFDDPATNTSKGNSEGETGSDGGCPDGTAGCSCYGNDTCNDGLECEGGTCKLPQCVAGSLNCDCYEGLCLTGLECVGGICKPEDPMIGCESTSDCDGDLCTQGDVICEGACQAGVEVLCPIGATCDGSSGSCACEPGTKVCGNECIPESQCCSDDDCSTGSTCAGGFCTCDGGLDCDGECLLDASCCPGETSNSGCSCGAQKTCDEEGAWGACTGGNPSPQCQPGQTMPCGNCGQRNCSSQCNWTTCQGEGPCSEGQQNCTAEGKLEVCQPGCYWQQQGNC